MTREEMDMDPGAVRHAKGCRFVISRPFLPDSPLEMGRWACEPDCPVLERQRVLGDPVSNLQAALRYMRERYSTPWSSFRRRWRD